MIQDAPVPDLYRGKVNLWVEDALSRDYLKECWDGDPDIFFLTAGGKGSILAAVNDAHHRGYGNVFGFRDRDFEPSNYGRWRNTRKNPLCFVPTVHEVENYLLDAPALAGCVFNTGDRTPEAIAQRMRKEAGKLVWWMACRAVIAGLHDEFTQDFPEHPKCDAVTDHATASNYIISQDWYRKLAQRAMGATGAEEVESRLRAIRFS
jgi:hypothetical protein